MQSISSHSNTFFFQKIVNVTYNQFLSGGKYWAVMNPKYAIINIDLIIAYNTAENSFIALNGPQLMCC